MKVTDELLLQVEKPARYIGNEINAVYKDLTNVKIRFAFCFPDVYEVGMSHLGMQIMYYLLNEREDTYCERAFAPWVDMERKMREEHIRLFALETQDALNGFDILGFTLQYEMSYTNIVNMLDLAGIPIYSKDRGEDYPIICAGGPCAANPEPLADIVDFFYIGEGEAAINDILDIYRDSKENGCSKDDFLKKLLKVQGVYVPKFYDVIYFDDGRIESFGKNTNEAPDTIRKVYPINLDETFQPDKQLVPLIETVHDRVAVEIFRGCIRGCRFCQAGYIYRPTREKSSGCVIRQAEEMIKNSGHEEISLVSLSTCDFSDFNNLTTTLVNRLADRRINISLPSLRIDSVSLALMEKIQDVRKSSLTFAPEAGSQRLRDVINKGLTEEEILTGARMAFEQGWDKVKLYFMIGLPTETEEDLAKIVELSEKIVNEYYEANRGKKKRPVTVTVSASCFVPKPFTPFQWVGQDDMQKLAEKQKFIRNHFNKKRVKFNYHDSDVSLLEAVVSRGDRKVGRAIVKAWELGARFDGWTEHFRMDIWNRAFESCGLDMSFYANRKRELDEVLPWDHISYGIKKEFLVSEYKDALDGKITNNCREGCSACGDFEGCGMS